MINYKIIIITLIIICLLFLFYFKLMKSNFYVCITTVKGYEEALENVLKSFPSNEKFIIVYQKENDNYYKQRNDGNYEVYLNKNIYDLGGCSGLYLLKKDGIIKDNDYILMIHDTCKLGENTFKLSKEIIENDKNFDIFWAGMNGESNICIIKSKIIDKVYKTYENVHYLDKYTVIESEWNHEHPMSMKNIDCKHEFYHETPFRKKEEIIYKKNGNKRYTLYYDSIDLEKYVYYVDRANNKQHPEKP